MAVIGTDGKFKELFGRLSGINKHISNGIFLQRIGLVRGREEDLEVARRESRAGIGDRHSDQASAPGSRDVDAAGLVYVVGETSSSNNFLPANGFDTSGDAAIPDSGNTARKAALISR